MFAVLQISLPAPFSSLPHNNSPIHSQVVMKHTNIPLYVSKVHWYHFELPLVPLADMKLLFSVILKQPHVLLVMLLPQRDTIAFALLGVALMTSSKPGRDN